MDAPPTEHGITDYDRRHLVAYLRLLDADRAGAAWDEVARTVLELDPDAEPERAREVHRAHLERVQWMSASGYRLLVREGRGWKSPA